MSPAARDMYKLRIRVWSVDETVKGILKWYKCVCWMPIPTPPTLCVLYCDVLSNFAPCPHIYNWKARAMLVLLPMLNQKTEWIWREVHRAWYNPFLPIIFKWTICFCTIPPYPTRVYPTSWCSVNGSPMVTSLGTWYQNAWLWLSLSSSPGALIEVSCGALLDIRFPTRDAVETCCICWSGNSYSLLRPIAPIGAPVGLYVVGLVFILPNWGGAIASCPSVGVICVLCP